MYTLYCCVWLCNALSFLLYSSPIVIDGQTAYLAGQLGVDKDKDFKLVPGGIEAETRQVGLS